MVRADELSTNRIYDAMAASYGFDVDATLSARLKYDLVLNYVRSEDEVLDIGCANGIHMRLVAPRCRHITGIDVNGPMLEVAAGALAGVRNVTLEQRSAADPGFAEASFDLVYSFSTLLLVPDIDRALCEIARVLRPGGIAILDITGRWNLSRVYWGMFYRRQGHFGVHSFRYRDILDRLGRLGLSVVESRALGVLDQWRYIPGLHWCKSLERRLHRSLQDDLDYRVSNRPPFFRLANRWYLVCRKVA